MNYELKEIPVDQLKLDPENYRLPVYSRGKSEKYILEYLLEHSSLEELMLAIGKNGYFPGEQLLVVRNPESSQDYKVIEGNRRLSAVKLLNDPNLVDQKMHNKINRILDKISNERKLDEIPSLIFNSEEEIRNNTTYITFAFVIG